MLFDIKHSEIWMISSLASFMSHPSTLVLANTPSSGVTAEFIFFWCFYHCRVTHNFNFPVLWLGSTSYHFYPQWFISLYINSFRCKTSKRTKSQEFLCAVLETTLLLCPTSQSWSGWFPAEISHPSSFFLTETHWDWIDGPGGKNGYCSTRGPKFASQQPS